MIKTSCTQMRIRKEPTLEVNEDIIAELGELCERAKVGAVMNVTIIATMNTGEKVLFMSAHDDEPFSMHFSDGLMDEV